MIWWCFGGWRCSCWRWCGWCSAAGSPPASPSPTTSPRRSGRVVTTSPARISLDELDINHLPCLHLLFGFFVCLWAFIHIAIVYISECYFNFFFVRHDLRQIKIDCNGYFSNYLNWSVSRRLDYFQRAKNIDMSSSSWFLQGPWSTGNRSLLHLFLIIFHPSTHPLVVTTLVHCLTESKIQKMILQLISIQGRKT